MPEIIVVCPHCSHKLALPEDYVGRLVSCLECHGPFRAPVREGDGFTEPVKLARSKVPAKIFIPLAGLLLLGVVSLVLNGYLLANPEAASQYTRQIMTDLLATDPPEKKAWKEADAKKKPDAEELKHREEVSTDFRRAQKAKLEKQLAEEMPDLRKILLAGLTTSALTFLGGLAFLLRRAMPLAYLGSIAAAFNSPIFGCCLVGFILAIWGVMALVSEEGRRWFRRTPL